MTKLSAVYFKENVGTSVPEFQGKGCKSCQSFICSTRKLTCFQGSLEKIFQGVDENVVISVLEIRVGTLDASIFFSFSPLSTCLLMQYRTHKMTKI